MVPSIFCLYFRLSDESQDLTSVGIYKGNTKYVIYEIRQLSKLFLDPIALF